MPVFTSHLVDYKALGVHTNLRSERRRCGYTLRQLASKTRLSEAKLSQLETGKAVPNLREIANIALALNLPVSRLIPRREERRYFVHHAHNASEEPPLSYDLSGLGPGPARHHNTFRPLAEPFVGRHLEPCLATIHPLADEALYFAQHDYEEFMFVLRGEVELFLKVPSHQPSTQRLGAGDSAYFRSCLPHCLRSTTDEPAQTLHVMLAFGGVGSDGGRYEASGRRYYRRVSDDSIVTEAADKIASLRRAHGLGLAELSSSVGTSVHRLAQIERGERPCDMEILLRLAKKFSRPLEYFCSTYLEDEVKCSLQRGAQIDHTPARQRGHSALPVHDYRPLAPGFHEKGMYPYHVRTVSVPTKESRARSHFGEEFVFVLDGEVDFVTEVNGKEVTEALHPGDSVYFDSSVPHAFRGRSRNPLRDSLAEVLAVFFSPLGESYLFAPPSRAEDVATAPPKSSLK